MPEAAEAHLILVVDDDEALSSLMARCLTRAGLVANTAATAGQAVEAVGRSRVDLMLLDFGLPDMTGLELTGLLTERGQSVPFIVVTGRGDERVAVEMMKSGALDYLSKDGALLELLPSVVGHALDRLSRDRRLTEAEATIRRQHHFLESVLNSLSHPLYVIDAGDYSVRMTNEAARRQSGNEGPACRAGQQAAPRPRESAACPVDEVLRTRKAVSIEHVAYNDQGQASVFEIHGYPIFDDRGEIHEVIEYHLDITQRKRAEQALRENEARLRQLVESLPILLVSLEPGTLRCLTIIGNTQELLGYGVVELMADPQFGLQAFHEEDRPCVVKAFEDAVTYREPFEVEFRFRHGSTKQHLWLREHVVPIFDEDDSLIRFDAVVVDVTQEKVAAEEHRRLEARLQQAARLESLGVLAGGIAHDFNNLLTIISGNSQFIRESLALGPAEAKALTDIETATRNAIDMTRSLQAFSRPNKPEIRTLDANQLIEETYRFLRRLIPRRIEFSIEPYASPCLVAVDPSQMQQVLVNLCVNSRDAIAGEGHLTIQTSQIDVDAIPPRLGADASVGRYVRIRVTDDGCGINAETMRYIFDPFFTTKTKDQGTGLGLAIVYRVVEAHQGVIDVNSEPGKGTEFSIFFPEARVEAPIEPVHAPAVARGNEQILVVDDETMIASLLKTLLESNGYKVVVSHDPQEAVHIARAAKQPFELAVVDYSLPGMDGNACLAELRKIWPGMKGLLITGYEMGDQQIEPGIRLLRKPFTAHSIIQTVRDILDNKES